MSIVMLQIQFVFSEVDFVLCQLYSNRFNRIGVSYIGYLGCGWYMLVKM